MLAADPLPGQPPTAARSTAPTDAPVDRAPDRPATGPAAPGAGDARPLVAFAHAGADWIRGSERCLLDLVAGLDRTRFRALVLCDAPALQAELARRGVEVVAVPRWKQSPVNSARIRRRLVPLLRARGVALLHANMVQTLPTLVPAAYRLRLPLVAHLHLPFAGYGERHQAAVREADVAVGVAEHVVTPLRAECGARGGCRAGVRVIHNAVDGARLVRGDARGLRAALGIGDAAFVAASVGSLIARKAHDVTLRALADARARGLDVHLLLCGDGEEDARLRALANTRGVARAAHFLGPRDDAGAVLRDAADVVVSSAREEALPLNLLEAQWLGVPVVASAIAAHAEALAEGVTGVLVEPGDPAALAGALAALAAAPDRRAALGAAGRALAAERYAMPRYVAAFEDLYAELLARPRAAYGGMPGLYWPRAAAAWLAIGVRLRLARRGARRRNGGGRLDPAGAAASLPPSFTPLR